VKHPREEENRDGKLFARAQRCTEESGERERKSTREPGVSDRYPDRIRKTASLMYTAATKGQGGLQVGEKECRQRAWWGGRRPEMVGLTKRTTRSPWAVRHCGPCGGKPGETWGRRTGFDGHKNQRMGLSSHESGNWVRVPRSCRNWEG